MLDTGDSGFNGSFDTPLDRHLLIGRQSHSVHERPAPLTPSTRPRFPGTLTAQAKRRAPEPRAAAAARTDHTVVSAEVASGALTGAGRRRWGAKPTEEAVVHGSVAWIKRALRTAVE